MQIEVPDPAVCADLAPLHWSSRQCLMPDTAQSSGPAHTAPWLCKPCPSQKQGVPPTASYHGPMSPREGPRKGALYGSLQLWVAHRRTLLSVEHLCLEGCAAAERRKSMPPEGSAASPPDWRRALKDEQQPGEELGEEPAPVAVQLCQRAKNPRGTGHCRATTGVEQRCEAVRARGAHVEGCPRALKSVAGWTIRL